MWTCHRWSKQCYTKQGRWRESGIFVFSTCIMMCYLYRTVEIGTIVKIANALNVSTNEWVQSRTQGTWQKQNMSFSWNSLVRTIQENRALPFIRHHKWYNIHGNNGVGRVTSVHDYSCGCLVPTYDTVFTHSFSTFNTIKALCEIPPGHIISLSHISPINNPHLFIPPMKNVGLSWPPSLAQFCVIVLSSYSARIAGLLGGS